MAIGQEAGDSGNTPLTVDSAASRLESILFSEEETQDDEAESKTPEQTTPKDEEPADEAETTDDEDEAEPSDSDESDETEAPDDETEQPQKHKVKVNGQDEEVTLDEALAGYSRQKDYTQKSQKLSDERKAFEAEQNTTRAERQRLHAALTAYEGQLTAQGGEPNWEKLLAEDPASFAATHAAWQIHQSKLTAAQQERARIEQQFQADAETQFNAHLDAEADKLEAALPEWKDADVAKTERTAIREYAHQIGFTDKELSGITDHRALLMLRKAMLFDKAATDKVAAAKKAQPKIDKVKAAKPGPATGSKREATEFAQRSKRLKSSNSVNDAASLIELMLGD